MKFRIREIPGVFILAALSLLLTGAEVVPKKEDYGQKLEELRKNLLVLDGNYAALQKKMENSRPAFFDVASICEGRLTTESGAALSTADRTGQSTLYFTPFNGSAVALYDGSIWELFSFTELSLNLAGLTSGKNYDVFLYNNAGTRTLELSSAWTNDLTRADAITTQDGVYVKSGATTRRYLGTIRTSSTTTTEDSKLQRFVWNYMNRKMRFLLVTDATDSWSYGSTTWRAARGQASNMVEYVVGINDQSVTARALAIAMASAGSLNYAASGVGIDSSSTNSAIIRGSGVSDAIKIQIWSEYAGYPGLGYHYLQWLEVSHATAVTFYGDNGDGTIFQSGLIAEIYN